MIILGFACSKDLGLYKNSYTGSYNGTKRDKSWIMYQNAKDTLYEYRFELIPKLNDSVIIKGPGIYQVFMPDSDGYYYDAGWPGNFIEIVLMQIPSVSNTTAKAIVSEFSTLNNLILKLKEDKNCLNNICYTTSKNQKRKISKTSIKNIQDFILV